MLNPTLKIIKFKFFKKKPKIKIKYVTQSKL